MRCAPRPQYVGKTMRYRAHQAIVRGYLAGSGWKEYQAQADHLRYPLPPGLVESSKLTETIFTPSTKAEIGDHDENISPQRAAEIVGQELADKLAERSLATYQAAHDYARGGVLSSLTPSSNSVSIKASSS